MDTTIVCFCHLRWNFTFQRPNHLMSRFSTSRRVLYIEEPVFDSPTPAMVTHDVGANVTVCVPHMPDTVEGRSEPELTRLVTEFSSEQAVKNPVLWFYTPMALPLASNIEPSVVVYDCMDELSLFLGAPPELIARERALLDWADIVFTGGHSLYEAKRHKHRSVHAFPSSVDVEHFSSNPGETRSEPDDQRNIPSPRVGFFGVIDERMDLDLLARVSRERPTYQFILVGPVVKIDEAHLPRASNIHYLGPKSYAQLPEYLQGWDVAMMPFALNESTRYISPTKTLEYMAGAKPIVSTAVRDVVVPYGQQRVVRIADATNFALAIDGALSEDAEQRAAAYRQVLAGTSWQRTWREMSALIEPLERKARPRTHNSIQSETSKGASECTTI